MRCFGVRPGGGEIALPEPSAFRFDSSEEAPADRLTAVFPARRDCGPLPGLRVRDAAGALLFDGVVDVLRRVSSGSGGTAVMTARSRAGLLLDSEALPQSYDLPSLPTVYEKHIRPYGFAGYRGSGLVFEGTVVVEKGMSEWQVAERFCRKYLLVAPRVRGGVFDASGGAGRREIRFGSRRGERYLSAELRDRYCDRLSGLYELSGGRYLPAARDEETAALGIVRNRCLTRQAEDPEAALRDAERGAFAAVVECPGAPKAEAGDSAALDDPALGAVGGLVVSEIRHVRDGGGERCRYVLRRE